MLEEDGKEKGGGRLSDTVEERVHVLELNEN